MKAWWFGFSGALAVSGCGGPTPATSPAASQAAAHDEPLRLDEARAFPPSPIPADAGVWIHAQAPGRDLPVFSAFGIGDPKVVAVLQNPGLVVGAFFGQAMERCIDLDKPVDVLYPPEEDPKTWSVAFTPVDAEHLGELRLSPRAPARWTIELPSEGRQPVQAHCELWHGAEPAGYRIVCADSVERVESHGRFYLGNPRQRASTASLRLEVPASVYRDDMKQAMKVPDEGSRADRAGAELGQRLMSEMLAEHRAVALELNLQPRAVEVALELNFTSPRTPVALWWAGSNTAPAGLTSAFWALPGDVDLALYKSGADAAAIRDAVAAPFSEFMTFVLEEYEVTPAQRREIENAFRGIVPRGGAYSFASGHRRINLESMLTDTKSSKAKQAAAALASLKTELAGWTVIGFDEPPEAYLAAVREFVRVAQIDLPKRKKQAGSATGTGSGTGAAATDDDDEKKDPDWVKFKLGPAPTRLPKGTLHVIQEVRPNPHYEAPADGSRPAPIPHDVHYIFVPDGQRTWVSIAQHRTIAWERALRVLQPKSDEVLAARPELAAFKAAPPSALGIVTIAGLLGLGMQSDSELERTKMKHALEVLKSLPRKGEAAIPIWMERKETLGDDGKPEVASRLLARLSPEAVSEVVQWLVNGSGTEAPAP